ncbi:MAG: hypothetical protein IKO66_07585 [Paludibacteraceae bacterium]|nr:hypothetical protein [Paludibacteraceae bacterium]
MLGLIFTLILHVSAGGSINEALEQARTAYATTGETTTILIEPGDYEEELTIDVPGLRLVNAAQTPGIGVRNGGVEIDSNAVRISWYYGHGYQYASMKGVFNYGGKRARRWNASVLVTAPRFYAENIIFQNSFNLYVSAREALDTLVDISQAKNDWTANERPKRIMPDRPKEAGNTDVQTRFYRERASALSFTAEAKDCVLKNCRVVGRQDAFYGDHGASVAVEGGVLAGAVDYIFGGLTLYVVGAELVGMISGENNDGCYITAGRAATPENLATLPQASRDSVPRDEIVEKGMLFVDCTVRHATKDELKNPGTRPIFLGRPWRWWGETVFVDVQAEPGVLDEKLWSLGLTKGHPAPFVRAE